MKVRSDAQHSSGLTSVEAVSSVEPRDKHLPPYDISPTHAHITQSVTQQSTSSSQSGVSVQLNGNTAWHNADLSTPRGHTVSLHQYVRVIAQALRDIGCHSTVDALYNETQQYIDMPYVQQLQRAVLNGEWHTAHNILHKMGMETAVVEQINQLCKIQEYIEMIADAYSGDSVNVVDGVYAAALHFLQTDIVTSHVDSKRVAQLASYLLCDSVEELERTAQWSAATSRQLLIDRISQHIPAHASLPPHRLLHIVDDAIQHQIDKCMHHDTGTHTFSLLNTHICSDVLPDLRTVHTIVQHSDAVNDIQFSHRGVHFASCSDDQSVILWSCIQNNAWQQPTVQHVLTAHKSQVQLVRWSWDDAFLLSAAAETAEFIIWDISTGNVISTQQHDIDEPITAAAWLPCARAQRYGAQSNGHSQHSTQYQLVTACTDGKIILWTLQYDNTNSTARGSTQTGRGSGKTARYICTMTYVWSSAIVQDIVCTPDGKYILTATCNDMLMVYDVHSTQQFALHGVKNVTSMCLSRDGSALLVSTRQPSALQLYAVKWHRFGAVMQSSTSETSHTHEPAAELITLLHESEGLVQRKYVLRADIGCTNLIGSGSEDGAVHVWRRGQSQSLLQLHGHTAPVNAVSWCNADRYSNVIVSCSDDHTIRVWADNRTIPSSRDTVAHNGQTGTAIHNGKQ